MNEPEIDLSDPPEAEPPPPITIAEVKECVKKIKSSKALAQTPYQLNNLKLAQKQQQSYLSSYLHP